MTDQSSGAVQSSIDPCVWTQRISNCPRSGPFRQLAGREKHGYEDKMNIFIKYDEGDWISVAFLIVN